MFLQKYIANLFTCEENTLVISFLTGDVFVKPNAAWNLKKLHLTIAIVASVFGSQLSAVYAGDINSGGGVITNVSGASNAASSITAANDLISIMRYSLELPNPTLLTGLSSQFTGLIGTLSSFAVSVTLDDDARKGTQTVIEIHQTDTATGIKTGSVGHYARSAGFSNEELAELMGWSE